MKSPKAEAESQRCWRKGSWQDPSRGERCQGSCRTCLPRRAFPLSVFKRGVVVRGEADLKPCSSFLVLPPPYPQERCTHTRRSTHTAARTQPRPFIAFSGCCWSPLGFRGAPVPRQANRIPPSLHIFHYSLFVSFSCCIFSCAIFNYFKYCVFLHILSYLQCKGDEMVEH